MPPPVALLAPETDELRGIDLVAAWSAALGIRMPVVTRPVDPQQVTGEDGSPGAELVGVLIRRDAATVLHTRELREDDVVHELLHVRCPWLTHEEVEGWTATLIDARRAGRVPAALARLTAAATIRQIPVADAAG